MPTQVQRSEATATALVITATRLFGERGYATVSIDDIAASAGLTKGALYHHFDSKAELFAAVFLDTHRRLAERIAARAGAAASRWDGLSAGAVAFLEECLDPAIRQIVVLDGPAVLGRQAVRAVEDDHVGGLLVQALTRLRKDDEILPGDSGLRARLILGALCEAALWIALSPSASEAVTQARSEISHLLDGFRRERS